MILVIWLLTETITAVDGLIDSRFFYTYGIQLASLTEQVRPMVLTLCISISLKLIQKQFYLTLTRLYSNEFDETFLLSPSP